MAEILWQNQRIHFERVRLLVHLTTFLNDNSWFLDNLPIYFSSVI